MTTLPKIYLASSSPRRQELLMKIGLDFWVVDYRKNAETLVDFNGNAAEYARKLAELKALTANVERTQNAIVLAFDTIVYIDGKILGKPRNEQEAGTFLRALSGKWHSVFTGISAISFPEGQMISDVEKTDVLFSVLSNKEIELYIASGEPMDKAGAYGIQGLGALLIEKIEGCYYNVIGLPLFRLTQVLERINFKRVAFLNLHSKR